MTKLEKLRDQEAEKHSLQKWPKQDDEYEGTHVAEGEYPSHYRSSVYQTFQAGWDARDAIAQDELAKLKEREAKLAPTGRSPPCMSGREKFSSPAG